jgi:GntR family transcriptional repressor for pyruvate dehydrogenase complex
VKRLAEQNHEYEKVIDYIRNQIEAENLTINSKLPTERAIAEELSISRNSTREALRILEHMGILKSIHGSGNYLTDNISMQMSEMLRYMILLKSISKLDICHFRRDMEKTVCRVVMKSEISEDELDKISDILNSESDKYDEVERDRLFHYSLIYATSNKLWICFMEAIMDIYREWIDEVLSNADSDTKKLLKEVHNSIFSSIKERDMAKCEASIDKHYDIIERELFMR